jgi:hypothetical protein
LIPLVGPDGHDVVEYSHEDAHGLEELEDGLKGHLLNHSRSNRTITIMRKDLASINIIYDVAIGLSLCQSFTLALKRVL